ncbi:Tetraspanin-6-like Protein [Tribolium castaneum]|uniref:Tetraspanin-6-like Protein n=1 Tax=Tribolium castaneum TaxID=7070 RepID=A0A139WFE6_TRICA|nr:Tetraspanin-6-like Protein [Tribolium castaneum]
MKFVLLVINVALTILASVLLTIGVLHLCRISHLTGLTEAFDVGYIVIGTGCLLLLTASVGGLVSFNNKKFLFVIYGILLIFAHILQMIMSILSFLEVVGMNEFINNELASKFKNYHNGSSSNKDEVERIQFDWLCCGFSNVTSNWKDPLPNSCCPYKRTNEKCVRNKASREDCKSASSRILQIPLKACVLPRALEFLYGIKFQE